MGGRIRKRPVPPRIARSVRGLNVLRPHDQLHPIGLKRTGIIEVEVEREPAGGPIDAKNLTNSACWNVAHLTIPAFSRGALRRPALRAAEAHPVSGLVVRAAARARHLFQRDDAAVRATLFDGIHDTIMAGKHEHLPRRADRTWPQRIHAGSISDPIASGGGRSTLQASPNQRHDAICTTRPTAEREPCAPDR